MGESSLALTGSKAPTTGCCGWWVKHFMRIRILSGHRHENTGCCQRRPRSRACVRCMRRLLYRQWQLQLGRAAPALAALASISSPDSGPYRRNASGRQRGIRQMLCLLECSIVCGSSGNLLLMKILVVDDHALIREALHGVLRKLTRDAVILEASNCAQTMEAVASHPDISLILLDLNLPDRDGFSMLAELRERNPAVSIVVLSAAQDRANVMKALDLGAMGYIPKSARNEVMLSALQLVFAGGIYIPPEILAREHLSHTAAPSAGGRAIVSPADLGLTDRQLDVLALMMQGKNNKSICRTLNLAEPTVKNHVTAILKALKVTNRTEAVIAVNELGWKLPATPKP
jgi:DNA-binding NarL/FixJ family response regulator